MNKNLKLSQNVAAISALGMANINILAMLVVGFGTAEEEVENYFSILEIIEALARKKIRVDGQDEALAIQFRPSPCILVPGSINYSQSHPEDVISWAPQIKPKESANVVGKIQEELEKIPYEYKRKTPSEMISSIIRGIQEANWKGQFRQIGIDAYIAQIIAAWKKRAAEISK